MARVEGGPYLVDQLFTIDVTITNHGTADSTGLNVYTSTVSGSWVSLQYPRPELPNVLPAGESVDLRYQARVFTWNGPPVMDVYITSNEDRAWDNNRSTVAPPFLSPDGAKGSVSGLLYGDRNGVREPLAGVQVRLNRGGEEVVGTTGTDGRFRVTDLPRAVYSIYFGRVPGGWVLPANLSVEVDGDESVEYAAIRPFTDHLAASVAFTSDTYAVGDTAQITVTLTNSGTVDLPKIVAFCDRSGGEGPHVVDIDLNGLAWDAGVAVPAGQTVTVTITGTVPPKTADYGAVSVSCSFGDDFYNERGFPHAYTIARVPAGSTHTWVRFAHDANGDDRIGDDEGVSGLTVRLVDWFSEQTVTEGVTDAGGRVDFADFPAGPYWIVIQGPWRFDFPDGDPTDRTLMYFRANCGDHCGGWTPPLVPAADNTPTPPGGQAPGAQTPAAPAAGGGAAALANTGATPLGLTMSGVLLLVAGAALLRGGRRRLA
ncbi:hypothetical protein [Saccharothrix texasensis]|uniref:hypothetical protein n=1 Tax=Saccharothrix texasensis TaxID=103734 RepID=UPI0011CE06CE|nr:hypothetical protein [Saccharothrix texasensis]